jgi:hypothetical protein
VKNPVRASAAGTWDAATLTEGHDDDPRVRKALRVVQAMLDGSARGRSLGRGNFGEAFEVRRGAVRVIIKIPVAADIHGRPWTMSTLRKFFLQEAGIANDLWDLGSSIVPRTTYVEVNGVPYLVREWGTIPANITPEEFDWLGDQLSALMSAGWKIADDLLVARRPNGALFVADVGMWTKRTRGVRHAARDAWDDLWRELGKLSGEQPWAPPGRGWYERRVPSAAQIRYAKQEINGVLAEVKAAEKEGRPGLIKLRIRALNDRHDGLHKMIERRRSVGLQ